MARLIVRGITHSMSDVAMSDFKQAGGGDSATNGSFDAQKRMGSRGPINSLNMPVAEEPIHALYSGTR